jgi:antitoxin CptB
VRAAPGRYCVGAPVLSPPDQHNANRDKDARRAGRFQRSQSFDQRHQHIGSAPAKQARQGNFRVSKATAKARLCFFAITMASPSDHGTELRCKRLLFRCWHRGTREMDLILGRFADAEIANLSDGELTELERLLEANDPDLYAAITGDKVLPADVTGALFARIKAFPIADRDA